MPSKSLADLAEKMADIDICILSTHTEGNAIAGRPMSNNGQVDLDGASYYFAHEDTGAASDIERDPNVALGFQGGDGFYLAVEGTANLVRDKERFAEHWTPALDTWFDDGVETEGLVLIEVQPIRIHYWDGREDGEIEI